MELLPKFLPILVLEMACLLVSTLVLSSSQHPCPSSGLTSSQHPCPGGGPSPSQHHRPGDSSNQHGARPRSNTSVQNRLHPKVTHISVQCQTDIILSGVKKLTIFYPNTIDEL